MNRQKFKFHKTKTFKNNIALLLAFITAISVAISLLTDRDTKVNVFTMGNVAIELIENVCGASYGSKEEEVVVGDVYPLDKIQKEPYVKNTGAKDAIVYMVVGLPVDNIELEGENKAQFTELFTILDKNGNEGTNSDWVSMGLIEDGYYAKETSHNYYLYSYTENSTLSGNNAKTEPLFNYVEFKDIKNVPTGTTYTIPITAFAVQSTLKINSPQD